MDKNKVLVGMSGGVDSAAAALLLQQAGLEAVGCTLRLYCCGEDSAADARRVAEHLGMAFYPRAFETLFRELVMDHFVDGYRAGRTPNPCIQCNRHVKFEALLHTADELGIHYIATGHYARVVYDEETGRWQLLRGADTRKDQSYVLYPLTQRQLSRLLLPLGGYDKASVRAIAQERGLINANRKDSQDICFIPDGDYTAFLQQYGGVELRPGEFVDTAGKILGRHRGLECYTTGQRRGLGVSADRPLYVLGKNADSNTVVLGDERELYSTQVWAEDFNWVSLAPISLPMEVTAKTRYSQNEAAATLYPEEEGRVRVVFREAQRAVTAGQALVVYRGEAVVGGGTICDFA